MFPISSKNHLLQIHDSQKVWTWLVKNFGLALLSKGCYMNANVLLNQFKSEFIGCIAPILVFHVHPMHPHLNYLCSFLEPSNYVTRHYSVHKAQILFSIRPLRCFVSNSLLLCLAKMATIHQWAKREFITRTAIQKMTQASCAKLTPYQTHQLNNEPTNHFLIKLQPHY